MQFRHLKTFNAVATTLNFTRAAEHVHLSQSSVTEQVQALEADLGVKLFDRSHRRLTLTPAGERLLIYAAELIKLADEVYLAVTRTPDTISGNLVIGGLETLCSTRLPELVAEFSRRYPAVEITLKTADSGGLRNGIRNGDIDVSFFFGDTLAATDVRSEPVSEEELLIIMPPNHRLAGRKSITPEDLVDEAFLVTPPGCIYRKLFDEVFAATLLGRPKRAGEFASIGLIRALVEAGLGCALVPRLALAARPAHVVVPFLGTSRTTPITMMWRQRRVQSPATDAFLSAARAHLRR
ncbi:LysR family transcriptional regulator [Agrobacterium vitis]|uniref:LysR family transcriptional regulator n=1 Tax=Agrobacterium vitis TaxID=373 RepID=UPI001572C789|nr:LysR family transcriptional regulator [Agrobacterium vitis]NSZ19890.1 LysR family transcriptional regulator [Agrobacterium vitis]QZO07585.1 LysR family transcriptional regulator [Agrobacterium vitis]UJL90779.1 LysR family transcriptional regulator [Agrobacterium vitis]